MCHMRHNKEIFALCKTRRVSYETKNGENDVI
nr:MAG TPA: hypothetical protein [Caudoviricetes sp.]